MRRYLFSVPGLVACLGLIALIVVGSSLPTPGGLGVKRDPQSAIRTIMQVVISLIVLLVGLFTILSKKYDADVQKWAFGIIGMIVGYWLPVVT
jgi:hypothetical protein